jgi:hypothetical protein
MSSQKYEKEPHKWYKVNGIKYMVNTRVSVIIIEEKYCGYMVAKANTTSDVLY